jgi:virginiamycin B lyase
VRKSTFFAALVAAVAVSAVATAAGPPTVGIGDAGATKFSIGGDWLTAGGGAVWISAEDSVLRIAPGTGRVVAKVRVTNPCEATDFAFNALWTVSCGSRPRLIRVDAGTNRVSGSLRLAIPRVIGGEGSIGAGLGGVWLVVEGHGCSACVLALVRPSGPLRVVGRVAVRPGSAAVRVGQGAVWVTNPLHNLVQKIDPRRRRVVATTKVGLGPRFFAVGVGAVWTLNQGDGSVTRLDPATARVTATIQAGIAGDGGDMAAGGGWVWARAGNVLLSQIDPRRNAVVKRYGPPSGSGAAIVSGRAVWVSAHDVASVWRLPVPQPNP